MIGFRTTAILSIAFVVSACATLKKDPWSWLDEPEEQTWKPVKIQAIGYKIEFSIPDRTESRGDHTQYWPESGASGNGFEFQLPLERIHVPVTYVSRFWWDTWWGGFYKKGGRDFLLSVSIWRLENDEKLLDLSLEQRVDWVSEYWVSMISKQPASKKSYREFFIQHLRVESFETASGLGFVQYNAPQISDEQRRFMIPLSDVHFVDFKFYVNKLRYGSEDNPQWNQSRWDLVEKIMKTVRITPDPFGD